ncbi:MAG: antitoxin Xre-like helix-turn-helix domain-containing protein [Pirellulales bacterium]
MAVFGNRPMTDAPGPQNVFAVPGGSLGLKSSNLVQVVRKLKSGLPYQSLAAFQRNSGLQVEIIGQVIQIPRRTLARRKVQGRFTPQESERLLRRRTRRRKTSSELAVGARSRGTEAGRRYMGGQQLIGRAAGTQRAR